MKPSIKKILERKAKLLAEIYRLVSDDWFRNTAWSELSDYQKMQCEMSSVKLNLVKKTMASLKQSNYIDLESMRDALLNEQEKLEGILFDVKKIMKRE